MSQTWPPKDPDEVLDYDVNWALDKDGNPGRTFGDNLISSLWIIDSGTVVINSNTFTTGATKVWLSGGLLGETSMLTNRIVTAGGRTMDQTIKVKLKAK